MLLLLRKDKMVALVYHNSVYNKCVIFDKWRVCHVEFCASTNIGCSLPVNVVICGSTLSKIEKSFL